MRDTASANFPATSSGQAAGSELIRMIHFGLDDCFRIPILESAGYSVDQCDSVSQLHAALLEADQADVVMMVENERYDPRGAMFLTRTTSSAALILFQSGDYHYEESDFDLIVQVLSDPSEWLGDIKKLIERRRAVRPQDRRQSVWQHVVKNNLAPPD